MAAYYVGLDVHVTHTTMCILDHHGKRVKRQTIRQSWARIAQELSQLPGSVAVCFEASTAYGYLFELLSQVAARVVVAHPGQLRLIFRSKQKNDRADAEKLAKLLFLDEVPAVYVPSREVRAWRQLVEYRRRLVAKRTRTKNAPSPCCGPPDCSCRASSACGPGGAWLGFRRSNCRSSQRCNEIC